MNVKEKVQAIKQGKLSSEKLCEEVLKAIEENDKNGRKVNEENYDPLSYAIYGLTSQEDEIIRLAYTLQESCPLETKPSWLD